MSWECAHRAWRLPVGGCQGRHQMSSSPTSTILVVGSSVAIAPTHFAEW